MGQASNLKELRKQLRAIVKEELPNLVKEELFIALQEENVKTLKQLQDVIVWQLAQMDKRQQDVAAKVMSAMQVQPAPEAVAADDVPTSAAEVMEAKVLHDNA